METIYVDSVRFTQSTLATAAHYMEMYPVDKDSTMGDIVIPTSLLITTKDGDKIARLTKSTQPYQKSVIGIVSDKTKAGETNSIGHNIDAVDNPQPIALAGRVPVKISSASSDIAPGDFITTSAELGKGMKAIKAGHMVGVALEPWLASEGKATVMVYVTNTYADPQDISSKFAVNENGEVIIPEYDTAISGIKDNVATQSGQLASLNSNVLGLNTTAASQAAELISLSEKIASMSSQLQNVDNEHDLTVTELTGIKADLEYLKMAGGSASSSGSLATAEDAQFSTLTVTDKTNVFDLGVTGTITAGIMTLDGVTGEINTLSDAIKLQPMGLGTVDIMGGKVDIDKKGNVAINSGHIKGNDSFRGKAMLKSGTNEIRVEKEWESMPFTVNVTSTYNTKIWVENIDTTGFTIKVDTTTSSDKEIHWIAVW